MAKSSREVHVAPGVITLHYSETEAETFAERWLAVYGTNRQGINAKAFLWHIFSAGRYPSVSGEESWLHYNMQEATNLVVLSNDRKQAFLTNLKPLCCSWSDCMIFPANLAWTMARTHEEGWLGPYFARHPRYTALEAENHAAIQKQREAEVARSKGWA